MLYSAVKKFKVSSSVIIVYPLGYMSTWCRPMSPEIDAGVSTKIDQIIIKFDAGKVPLNSKIQNN